MNEKYIALEMDISEMLVRVKQTISSLSIDHDCVLLTVGDILNPNDLFFYLHTCAVL